MCSAWSGRVEIAKWLHEAGALLRPRPQAGYTALLWSTLHGKLPFLKWLVANNVPLTDKLGDGRTAILLAASEGHLETVKWLIEQNCSLMETNKDEEDVLLVAARSGYLNVVEYALEHGSSIIMRNSSDYSAFLLAAQEGHLDVVQFLADRIESSSEQIPHFWEEKNSKGYNALFLSVHRNYPDVLTWCIQQNKFDLSQKVDQEFILEEPALRGYREIVRILLYTNQLKTEDILIVLEKVKSVENYDSGVVLCLEYWLEWPRLRLLWIGHLDPLSPLSMLPREIIRYIFSNVLRWNERTF